MQRILTVVLAVLVLLATRTRADDTKEMEAASALQKSMIWLLSAPEGKQAYVVFRKEFDLDAAPSIATLRIFADTRYMLWINGQYVDNGPCRFDPKRPEYDVHDVHDRLRKGRNAIAVVVHYYAVGSFKEWGQQCARMMDHRPGLTADLAVTLPMGKEVSVRTDESWHASRRTRYLPSPGTYTTVPDNIDARIDAADWTVAGFDDSNWERAARISGNDWGKFHERSIPLLRKTVYEPLRGKLPLTISGKKEIDVGRCVQAYIKLDFEANEGVQLVVNPKGHRYITRKGRQTYITGDTAGFHKFTLQVNKGEIILHGVEVVDRRYPYDRLGRFACNDPVLSKLWDVCVNTVELCSEDAYVDCADRERAQWMADGYMMSYPVSRVALAGPGREGGRRYSDPRLLKNMLRHMGFSQLRDGRLQPMRPSEYPVTGRHGVIDDYTCLWVHAVREHCDRAGDDEFAHEVWPTMVKALDYFLTRRTERGLVKAGEFVYFGNPLAYVECEGASINAYVYRALRDAARVGRWISETVSAKRFDRAADELYLSYNEHLWDTEAGSYYGSIITDDSVVGKDTPPSYCAEYKGPLLNGNRTPATGHAALMALYFDLVPVDRRERVFEFMFEHFEKEQPFPYTTRYYLDVLYRHGRSETDLQALNFIRRKFGHMTSYETGTTSEAWNGGSFMHESGAHPAYFLSSYVLGVRTEGPCEARRLLIDPRLSDLDRAEGTTLTEFGPVTVRWKRDGNQALDFELDNGTTVPAMLSLRLSDAKASLTSDGRSLLEQGVPAANHVNISDGRVSFPLAPGRHTGRIIQKR